MKKDTVTREQVTKNVEEFTQAVAESKRRSS